jgi:signal transduction histidine kinase
MAFSTKEEGDEDCKGKGKIDVVVEGDRDRIIQVVSNIIDNAIRFTGEGTISITVDDKNSSSNGIVNSNKDQDGKSLEEIVVKVRIQAVDWTRSQS